MFDDKCKECKCNICLGNAVAACVNCDTCRDHDALIIKCENFEDADKIFKLSYK